MSLWRSSRHACFHSPRADEAIVTYKSIAPDTALELARAALATCRNNGYQVAVVVIDRFGGQLVLLRDRFAGLPSAGTANDKAYTALSFRRAAANSPRRSRPGSLAPGLPHCRMS